MDTIFLDTVGLVALWNRRDQWHVVAKEAFAKLLTRDVRFVSTTFVLLECGNAAARHPFRADVLRLRDELLDDGLLIEPTATDCEQAWAAYERGDAGNAGIVDHTSFVVMRRLGLTEAFTLPSRWFRHAVLRRCSETLTVWLVLASSHPGPSWRDRGAFFLRPRH